MNNCAYPACKPDGDCVDFDWNGISLIEGEYTNLSYTLVTIVALRGDAYERILAEYQDSETFKEVDGKYQYVSTLDEINIVYQEGGVEFSICFDSTVDEARASKLMEGIRIELR